MRATPTPAQGQGAYPAGHRQGGRATNSCLKCRTSNSPNTNNGAADFPQVVIILDILYRTVVQIREGHSVLIYSYFISTPLFRHRFLKTDEQLRRFFPEKVFTIYINTY